MEPTTVRIIYGVLAVVLLTLIIMRRRHAGRSNSSHAADPDRGPPPPPPPVAQLFRAADQRRSGPACLSSTRARSRGCPRW